MCGTHLELRRARCRAPRSGTRGAARPAPTARPATRPAARAPSGEHVAEPVVDLGLRARTRRRPRCRRGRRRAARPRTRPRGAPRSACASQVGRHRRAPRRAGPPTRRTTRPVSSSTSRVRPASTEASSASITPPGVLQSSSRPAAGCAPAAARRRSRAARRRPSIRASVVGHARRVSRTRPPTDRRVREREDRSVESTTSERCPTGAELQPGSTPARAAARGAFLIAYLGVVVAGLFGARDRLRARHVSIDGGSAAGEAIGWPSCGAVGRDRRRRRRGARPAGDGRMARAPARPTARCM